MSDMRMLFLWLRILAILFAWVTGRAVQLWVHPMHPLFDITILLTLGYGSLSLLIGKHKIGPAALPTLILAIGDVIALTIVTIVSGGIESPWFVMYYLVLAVASLQFSMRDVIIYAAILSASYTAAVNISSEVNSVELLVIRVFVLISMGIITASLARELVAQRLHAEQRARAQHLLRESSQSLSGSLHIEEIGSVLEQAGRELGGSDSTLLLVYEDATNTTHQDNGASNVLVRASATIDDAFGTEIVEKLSQGYYWTTASPSEVLRELAPELKHACSISALPLLLNEYLTGIILLGWNKMYLPTSDDMELLSTLASQVSVALETARLYSKALNASITDPLTGLYNHRYFKEQLEMALFQARAKREPLTVMMIDLDRFKSYNDMLGHAAGDTALRAVAAVLEQELHGRATTARYGGDEFVVLLSNTDMSSTKQYAQRIHRAIADMVTQKYVPSVMSLSIGLASFPEHGDNRARLLDSADLALSLSKHDGGGCTNTANDVGSARGVEAVFAKIASYLAQSRSSSGPGIAADLERRLQQLEMLNKHENQGLSSDPVAETLAIQTVTALAMAIEAKDSFTRGHSHNVAAYAVELGRELACSEFELEELRISGLLHDIGKIGITDTILNKPGPLDEHEYAVMKTHSEIGARILTPVQPLRSVAKIVLHHHERFDGGGYPAGLAAGDIPLASRIIAICDAYDVMTMGRPYRKATAKAEALRRLQEAAGTQFDADLVNRFISLNTQVPVLMPNQTASVVKSI